MEIELFRTMYSRPTKISSSSIVEIKFEASKIRAEKGGGWQGSKQVLLLSVHCGQNQYMLHKAGGLDRHWSGDFCPSNQPRLGS